MEELETTQVTPAVPPTPTTPVAEVVVPEEVLNRIREQESRKMYARLEKEAEKAKKADEKAQQIEAQLKELQSFKEQAELEKLGERERLDATIKQLQTKLQDAETTLRRKEEILTEKIRLFDLAEYRQRRVAEERIDEDFVDFVTGNSEDEIEAGIAKAKEKEAKFRARFAPVQTAPVAPSRTNPPSPATNLAPETLDLDNLNSWDDVKRAKAILGIK